MKGGGEEREKTRQTEEEGGRQHQGVDSPGLRQVPEASGEQRKMEEAGCENICSAPTTLAVKTFVRVRCCNDFNGLQRENGKL